MIIKKWAIVTLSALLLVTTITHLMNGQITPKEDNSDYLSVLPHELKMLIFFELITTQQPEKAFSDIKSLGAVNRTFALLAQDKTTITAMARYFKQQHSAFIAAVKARHYALVNAFIGAGVTSNIHDGEGYTPLMLAIKNRDLPMVEILIAAKADPNRARVYQDHSYHFSHNPDLGERYVWETALDIVPDTCNKIKQILIQAGAKAGCSKEYKWPALL